VSLIWFKYFNHVDPMLYQHMLFVPAIEWRYGRPRFHVLALKYASSDPVKLVVGNISANFYPVNMERIPNLAFEIANHPLGIEVE